VTRPAAFLDRDGTLLEDRDYAFELADYHPLAGAYEAVARLRAAGFAPVVLTNQSGIGRGLFRASDYARFEAHFLADFAAHGAALDGCYHCPHAPDAGCDCRKPATGLALRAARELGLDLGASVVIGDKASDVELAQKLGCRALLVLTGKGREEAERLPRDVTRARDVLEAVEFLLSQPRV
jgi:D-glycero-D-manno-heptose 1,7-bisphosphate phosphatase